MITSKFENLPKSQIEITITITNDEIKKEYEKVMETVVSNAEIKGFRKGKAPRNVVESSVEKDKVYQQVFQQLLPKGYFEAVKEHNLQPIMDPVITLVSPEKLTEIETGAEVVFKAKTAVRPEVKLNGYKEKIKALKAKDAIWVPGKDQPDKKPEKQGPSLEEIVAVLLEFTEVEIPDLLIENEANRFLSQTLDEIKKLGLTLDQYLSSTKKTAEDLKAEAAKKAAADLKLEFVLGEIAKTENISVTNEEIEKVIHENPDEKARENLHKQQYMLGAIILQQKTLDYCKNL